MLEKFIEGKNVLWIVDLKKQIDDYPLFMDATSVIDDAIQQDVKNDYPSENGPMFSIEVTRLRDYVNYIADKIDRDNYLKFDTQKYRLFLGSIPVR